MPFFGPCNTEKNLTHATCELDFKGGSLSLPTIGVYLKVPEGALPEDIPTINMSLALHQDQEDHPQIDRNHLMITPIICCGPEGVEFNRPVTLILPHSVNNFKDIDFEATDKEDIHLWFKSDKGMCMIAVKYVVFTFLKNLHLFQV